MTSPASTVDRPRALAGLKVLDLSILYAAPQVAAILGDLGADVVKVELPPRGGRPGGDPLRFTGELRNGHSLLWAQVSRNKRSITLDADTEQGRALLARLVHQADVVVENLTADVLQRWDCTPQRMLERNPRLVVVTVSCYGTSGPQAGSEGNGSLAEAFAGLTHLTGERDGPPLLTSALIGDTMTAISGVVGALAACYWRDARGGTGQHVDVSMYEPVLQLVGGTMVTRSPDGPEPTRNGSRIGSGVPRNIYRTADDSWIVVSAGTDKQIDRLLPLLGRDDEASRARFGRSADRLCHAEELDALVAQWVRAQTRAAVLEQLRRSRLPAGPVNTLADVLRDPHVRARGSVVEVIDSRYGQVTLPAPAPKLQGTPAEVRWVAPELGEHTHAVLEEWLGMGSDDVARLQAERII
ncbi:MAG TPA: CoA transferase [Ramlibacter sp.]|nr:CoA transferase [Ramlibacter sp.]